MSPEELLQSVQEAFADVSRPELFIRGTCRCDECQEHNHTLASHSPDSITLNELGNPGWDPMCFASDQAFSYYLPAMIRIALSSDYYYLDQLLFHLNSPGRIETLSASQANAVLNALWAIVEMYTIECDESLDDHLFDHVIEKLNDQLNVGLD